MHVTPATAIVALIMFLSGGQFHNISNTLFSDISRLWLNSGISFRDIPQLHMVLWSDHQNRYLHKQMYFKDIRQTFQRNFLSEVFEYEDTGDEIQKKLDGLIVTLKNNSKVKKDENSFYFNKKDLNPGISVTRGALPI